MEPLKGMRIAVVEDDGVLALALRDRLEEAGAEVVYEANDFQSAMAVAAMDGIDAAVLDIKLDGRSSFAAAAVLQSHGVPFVFASANGPGDVPARLRTAPFVRKPYDRSEVVEAVVEATRPMTRREA